jgi:hypothetical protein
VTEEQEDVLRAMLDWATKDAALRERHRTERHELGLKFDLMGRALTPSGRFPRTAQSLAAFVSAQNGYAAADLKLELRELLDEGEDDS